MNQHITTTITHAQRIFVVEYEGSVNPILCNLDDLERVCKELVGGYTKIKHFFDGRIQRISKKDLKDMLEANKLNSSFL